MSSFDPLAGEAGQEYDRRTQAFYVDNLKRVEPLGTPELASKTIKGVKVSVSNNDPQQRTSLEIIPEGVAVEFRGSAVGSGFLRTSLTVEVEHGTARGRRGVSLTEHGLTGTAPQVAEVVAAGLNRAFLEGRIPLVAKTQILRAFGHADQSPEREDIVRVNVRPIQRPEVL